MERFFLGFLGVIYSKARRSQNGLEFFFNSFWIGTTKQDELSKQNYQMLNVIVKLSLNY
jgi:hypothetical protein